MAAGPASICIVRHRSTPQQGGSPKPHASLYFLHRKHLGKLRGVRRAHTVCLLQQRCFFGWHRVPGFRHFFRTEYLSVAAALIRGAELGDAVGSELGSADGEDDGERLGDVEGIELGTLLGVDEGIPEGRFEGTADGCAEGVADGSADSEGVGSGGAEDALGPEFFDARRDSQVALGPHSSK